MTILQPVRCGQQQLQPTIRAVAGANPVDLLADVGITTARLAATAHLAATLEATGLVSEREVKAAVDKAKQITASGEEATEHAKCDKVSVTESASHFSVTPKENFQETGLSAGADCGASANADGGGGGGGPAAGDELITAAASSSSHAASAAGEMGESIAVCENCPALKRNKHPETGEVWVPYNADRCLLRVCDAVYECGAGCPYGKNCILKLVQHGAPQQQFTM